MCEGDPKLKKKKKKLESLVRKAGREQVFHHQEIRRCQCCRKISPCLHKQLIYSRSTQEHPSSAMGLPGPMSASECPCRSTFCVPSLLSRTGASNGEVRAGMPPHPPSTPVSERGETRYGNSWWDFMICLPIHSPDATPIVGRNKPHMCGFLGNVCSCHLRTDRQ